MEVRQRQTINTKCLKWSQLRYSKHPNRNEINSSAVYLLFLQMYFLLFQSNTRLYNELGCTDKSKQVVPANSEAGVTFTHVDFVYSDNIEENLHEPLLEKIKEIESSTRI